jgi:hypothetical protein
MAKNKSEGSRSDAKHYDEGVKRTAQSGRMEQAARDAAKQPEDKAAEGKRHSHGEDPALRH